MGRFTSSRARGITRAAALTLSAALIATATACAPAPSDAESSSDTLVLGIVGSTKDEVQPYGDASAISNGTLVRQLYNGLTTLSNDGGLNYDLAESMDPNDTLDEWTIHLREGVKLHNGEEFTADDVIESLDYILDPENAFPAATAISMVDPDGITKVDDHTVEMKLTEPYGPLPFAFASERLVMRGLDDPSDPDTAVGTGPFTLDSFTAGQEAKLTKFDDYWGETSGFDHLKLAFFQDQQAITNALRGGQIDVAYSVPYTDVASLEKEQNIEILVSDSASYQTIAMRMDLEPFDDPRVREALRLSINRQQIVDNAFGGFAAVANDFYGKKSDCPTPDVAQREQDIERAKKLLAEAGKQNLELELVTDGGFPGMMEVAQLFAQNASEAGIDIQVKKLDVATFLSKWTEWPFAVAYAGGPYLQVVKTHLLPGGEENTAHMDDPELNALAAKLFATADETEQCNLITQMQEIEYERGGYIVPAFSQSITAYRDNVQGLKKDLFGRSAIQFAGVTVS
ncbi:ABC transporter substrate-binding protein [Leucobacter sp. HY1910]